MPAPARPAEPAAHSAPWKSQGLLPLSSLALTAVIGCATVGVPASSIWRSAGLPTVDSRDADLPDRTEIAAGQLVIHADFQLAAQHRLVRELESLRVDVSQELGLPVSDEPVHLYLFATSERYDAFAARRFPGFPSRRAFFVETDTSLSVFAAWQDRIAEDLRHETTHGYVHAVAPGVPLWLDEGIAEYFELPRSSGGVHRDHVDHLHARILEGTWRADLIRLESLRSAATLSQDDYAESWAWVHWMLATTDAKRRMLQAYLADIRFDPPAAVPLSVRLVREGGEQGLAECTASLKAHVEQLAARGNDPEEPSTRPAVRQPGLR
jgi:hypothetical protein